MKTLHNKVVNTTSLACAVALALSSAPSWAQDNLDETVVEKISVTGSRISRDSALDTTSPVFVIGGEDIQLSGQIDIGALLRESPQLQGSLPGSFSAFNGSPLGASLLNLRNLGEERTLVVENGRRHISGIEGTASVDVNTISTALLKNVEILTGGASAIYGADAVSGVVNFNIRDGKSFDGIEVRTQTGVTDDGDANEFFISVANGIASNKGDLVFAVEYQQTSPVFARDRSFAGSGLLGQVTNNEATQNAFGVDSRFANTFVPDERLPISSAGGVISLSGSAFGDVFSSGGATGCGVALGSAGVPTCQFFAEDGLRAFNPGDVFVDAFAASGGDGVATEPDLELILPDTKRLLFQTSGSYELADFVNVFVDAKYVTSDTQETNQVNGFNDDIPILLDNPFIPDELANQIDGLVAEGVDVNLVVSRDVLDITARSNPLAERRTFRVVTGFEGYIPGTSLDFEVFYNYGRTDADTTSNERLEDRYFAAIDAVVDPVTGNTVCRSDIDSSATPPSSPFPVANENFAFTTFDAGDGQCVPISIFGENSISAEGAAFIFQSETERTDIEQRNFLAAISGDSSDLFELPAGAVNFAVGYEYRKESSSFTPGNFSAAGFTFETQDSQAGPTNPSNGEYDVSEFFAEVDIPILSGKPFAEKLDIRAAYRISDYDPYGSFDTYSYGFLWSPIDTLTVKSTYSEAVRVPNINEAFAPTFLATLGASDDPCNQNFIEAGSEFREANCIALIGNTVADGTYDSTNFLSAFVPGTTGGNPDLNPEEAETLTVGIAWAPQSELGGFFEGLSISLDYYEIDIDGLIDSLDGFDIAQNCVDAPTIDNVFCDAIQRDATDGFITDFQSGFINLAAVSVSGVDFSASYGFEIAKGNKVDLSLNGTRFIKNDEVRDVSAPEAVTDVLGTFNNPEWIMNFNIDYSVGDFVFGWSGRFEDNQLLPGLENDDIANNPDFISIANTGTAFVHDFSVSYNYSKTVEIYGGVNNAFEEDPFIATLSRPAGPRGRFYFVGLNFTI
ncbi:TonB-dependent receptor [Alteromonas sp. 5E99-2]|uniref:TonB-dependent receptor domain-containing protein n=1 Tax=Alteromonas sp. 5E99-2 TaxID=2817683 RepID=UPI001A99D887|nr:TonB-dependent receptor [Alteromonas sp. 5E99-2]MBO1254204.1 TonB-dependent receptor [Alteromonas sp. 5E99-2]